MPLDWATRGGFLLFAALDQPLPPASSIRVLPSTIRIQLEKPARSETVNELSIIDQAAMELPEAMAALDAGDEQIKSYTRGVRQLLDGVTSKSRDELQTVIGAVRAKEFPVALQFQNFRD